MIRQGLIALFSLTLLFAAAGCEPEVKVVRPSFAGLREVSDKPRDMSSPSTDQEPIAGHDWSIPLITFEGPDRFKQIEKARRQLLDHNLPDMWFEDYQNKATLYSGRFASPGDPQTQQTLDRIREIEIEGDKPYAKVKIIPLVGGHRVQLDPFDLQQFVGFFSLQVAVFTENYAGDRRAAAEQVTRDLRQKGEEAYFYHGPRNSSVCIGLFTYDDFIIVNNVSHYGPRIKDLQARYPFNLIDAPPGTEPQPQETSQPSTVSIPTPEPAQSPTEGEPAVEPSPDGSPPQQPSILFRVI
ncbi:MAG: hypothetical protein IT445_11655 [Phycisphaeraceae bacterium]|nr:hypothetical protein [Phycisphaeraceae bacterium]